MKKTLAKKLFSAVLAIVMIAQAIGTMVTVTSAESPTGSVEYTDGFDYDIFDRSKAIWTAEFKKSSPSSCQKYYDFASPTAENGVIYLDKAESAELQWTNIAGIQTSGTYTIKFDLKVTDFGDGKVFCPQKTNYVREFYTGIGGWLDQMSLQKDSAIYVGGQTIKNTESYTLNTVYSVEMVWDNVNGSVKSTLKNGDTVILSGTRTSNDYKGINDYTKSWVFRCCDGAIQISNFSFSDGTTTYAPSEIVFQNRGMNVSGYWTAEQPTGSNKFIGTAPTLENGVAKLTTGNSIQFHWDKLMSKSEYDADSEYVYEFDFKVTDKGNGADQGTGMTRALYVAPGGWYNQLQINDSSGKIVAGATKISFTDSMLNVTYRAKLSWTGTTITTTVFNPDGTVLVSGSRTSDSYAKPSTDAYMTSLALRCEDGAVEIDNFKFYTSADAVSQTSVSIESGKQAVYECDLVYNGKEITVTHGTSELFAISDSGIRLCGNVTQGNYGNGSYRVKAVINPVNKMTVVELTLPNGGTVRRGAYASLSSATAIEVFSNDTSCVYGAKVEYIDATANEYTLNSTEPVYTGFGANVYNLVTSFSDAEKDRAFAWTAQQSFVGTGTMAVRYRAAGETQWTVADAERETEKLPPIDGATISEYYFKADISGLTAGVTYEYQIGIKNSETDWSKTYTFKTAAETINEFSFIALGDTQGNSWNGSTRGNKGFMYTQATLNEAFQQVNDPAFILHTGDVVETGYIRNYWNQYFKALGEYGASTPVFTALGNHDAQGVYNDVYFDFHFNHPNNGGSAAFDADILQGLSGDRAKNLAKYLDETVYSFNYGEAHFVVLMSGDARTEENDKVFIDAQRAWLENDLKANADARWTVVMVHAPFYHRTGEAESRGWLADVVESNGVDLVIQGHSHLVTRTYPMKDGKIVTKESPDLITKGTGTVYTTIGSTTYNHDALGNPNVEECMTIVTPNDAIPAYTEVKVDGDKIVMTVRQIDGLVLDEFTIVDRPEVVLEGFQTTEGDADHTVDARFVASLQGDYRDYESVGFEFTYNGDVATPSCKYVYESLLAGGNTISPNTFGANYFFCYTIADLAPGEYTFEIRAWHVKKGSDQINYSEKVTASFTVGADGTVAVNR